MPRVRAHSSKGGPRLLADARGLAPEIVVAIDPADRWSGVVLFASQLAGLGAWKSRSLYVTVPDFLGT